MTSTSKLPPSQCTARSAVLALQDFLPAPAQGVLAIQVRKDDDAVRELVVQIDDPDARATASAERAVLAALHGGCSIPLGVYAQLEGDTMHLDAMIADMAGETYIRHTLSVPLSEVSAGTQQLAQHLLDAGGQKILDDIRNNGPAGNK
ncbi:hypothetical protein ACFL6U_04075 [Planctomycetota bacterium]